MTDQTGQQKGAEANRKAALLRDKGILAALDVVLDRYRAPRLPDLPPLQSGVVGYLGYDVVREIERLPSAPPDDRGLPDAVRTSAPSTSRAGPTVRPEEVTPRSPGAPVRTTRPRRTSPVVAPTVVTQGAA